MSKRLFIFAGEQSGDLHGSHLIKALKDQSLSIDGVAGPRMRSEGMHAVLPMEDFEVMGFSDVVRSLPKLYRQFRFVRDHILSTSPEGVVLIDYPGFNLRLAKALRKGGFKRKIIQYISPSVWAWGSYRIEQMTKTYDHLLTIYPFEKEHFARSSLPVTYVGNPLCEYIKNYHYKKDWRQQLNMPLHTPLVGLFPGSRQSEIGRNLPILLETAEKISQRHPKTIFAVSCAHPAVTKQLPENFFCVPKEYTYELMRDCRTALAKSGTVTLELALHGCPTVAIYKLTLLNRLYAQYILRVNLPHYCIVNILSQKEVFPELIEAGLSTKNLLAHFESLHTDGPIRQECLQACQQLPAHLERGDASQQAASAIMRVLAC